MSNVVDSLVTQAGLLHALADELNTSLLGAECAIGELGLGVNAEVPMPGDRLLGYGKINGRWCLYVVAGGEAAPLLNTSRQIRVESVAHLPTLMTALGDQIRREIDDVTTQIRNVKRFTAGVTK